MIELWDGELEGIVGESPVVVEFWAPWCGPCVALGATFEEVAERYGARARFVKVRVDECPGTRDGVGVTHVPTVAVFVGGKEVARVVDPGRGELVEVIEAGLRG
jgi:thioredoxin 1